MELSVEKIASLAYLHLKEDEKKRFETQFENILKYVKQLENIPMNAEEAHAMGRFHILTAFVKELGPEILQELRNESETTDVGLLNLTNAEALKNSPSSSGLPDGLMFEVPSIIERS